MLWAEQAAIDRMGGFSVAEPFSILQGTERE